MPVTPADPEPAARSRHGSRPLVAAALAALLLVGLTASLTFGDGAGDRLVTRDGDRSTTAEVAASRSGRPTPDPVTRPTDPGRRAAARDDAIADVAPVGAAARPAIAPRRRGPSGPPATGTAPSWLGGAASSPTGSSPARPGPTTAPSPSTPPPPTRPASPTSTVPAPSPSVPSTPTSPVEPEPLAFDQRNCPNLNLVAIGDTTGAPAAIAQHGPRFRAQAAAITGTEALVCALPLEAWRDDLVIQRLRANGEAAGVLVAGLDAAHPVLRFSDIEWTSFQFRSGGPADHNFAGVPLARQTIGGVEVIRTTRGGLVMERSDTWGNVVLSGAWDAWMQRGGPTGPMGLPRGKPTGRFGLGAFQDFDGGHLLLPGVSTDLEAETRPGTEYEWHPATIDPSPAARPGPNSIVVVTGTAYYVDAQGIRHWLTTGSDWSCAYWDLGAREVEVRGWVLAQYPPGPAFVCP